MSPVGLPWASWQWKISFGGSVRVSPFDELAVERRLLEEEYEDGRLEIAAVGGALFGAVVVAAVSDVDGILPSVESSFLICDFRLGGKIGMSND